MLAAARDMTLKQFFTEALEDRIRRSAAESDSEGTEPPWMAGFGELSHLGDDHRHIRKLIEEEFERHSPDDRL